jgi:hypothetical protein
MLKFEVISIIILLLSSLLLANKSNIVGQFVFKRQDCQRSLFPDQSLYSFIGDLDCKTIRCLSSNGLTNYAKSLTLQSFNKQINPLSLTIELWVQVNTQSKYNLVSFATSATSPYASLQVYNIF